MAYVLYGDKKYNIIWGRDFNTQWKMINNNLWAESARDMIKITIICDIVYIPHISYNEWRSMWVQINAYDIITFFSYAMYTMWWIIMNVDLNKNCECSYIMQFKFNNFSAHPSIWILKCSIEI